MSGGFAPGDNFKGRAWVDDKKMNLFPFVAAWFVIDLSGSGWKFLRSSKREEKVENSGLTCDANIK